ncbi:MAG: type III pantothenate kinase [Prolixibacteraceae bacterium]|nr:type III pantothenate kinase [Prolixibacteraceae bacterium]MBN2773840.1 type III pantothenate kinase [Prolixibacteraceae bacterium]
MLLAVDIGNTNIVMGINDSGKWLYHWRIHTDSKKTADEYEIIINSLLLNGKICKTSIKKIVVSSVVPTLVAPFTKIFNRLLEIRPILISHELYQKLPVKILNPHEIGTDLVANAVAAFTRFGNNTMVVDFGTALTFTTIGANAEIKGVAIAPGLVTAMSSLAGNTAQLPFVHLEEPPSVLGDNTIHAIQSGIMYGYSGLADKIIEKTEQELQTKLNVVATGGLSSEIVPLTSKIQHIDKMLTLEGLKIIGEIADQK